MPTVNDIFEGMLDWILMQTEKNIQDLAVDPKKKIIKCTRINMEKIFNSINLDKT